MDELESHCEEICRKSRISKDKFFQSIEEMELFVKVIEDVMASDKAKEGKKLAPHLEDAPLLALALTLGCPIWSKEEAFKDQTQVKIYNTYDIIRLMQLD
jgi:predicted nucleic acid-binding protein